MKIFFGLSILTGAVNRFENRVTKNAFILTYIK